MQTITKLLISTICEAVQRSLFWTPNGLNELREVRFEFPFNLIGDHDKQNKGLFLTGQSWHVLKSEYTARSPEQGFWRRFTDRVNQSLISSARRLKKASMVKAAVFVCESIVPFNTPDLEKHNHIIFEYNQSEASGKNILLTDNDSFMHFS